MSDPDYSCHVVIRLKATAEVSEGSLADTPPESRDEAWLDGFADEIISAFDREEIDYDGQTYTVDALDIVDLEESNP